MSREIKAVDSERPEPSSAIPLRVSMSEVEKQSLAEYFYTITQARWLISIITVATVVAGAFYLFMATPIYRSDVLLQVEENQRGIAGLQEVQAILQDRSPGDTEMEILRSRSLIGTVVDDLGLEFSARPKRFPLLGSLAHHYRGAAPASAFLGLSSYAWGGERIRLERLDVPQNLIGIDLTLTATATGYELHGPNGEPMLTGIVGKTAVGKYGGERVEAFVSDLSARPRTRFIVRRLNRLSVIESLQQRLRISEKGKKTGILVVALDGSDPHQSAAILDAVAATYVRQNVERKSAEAAKTLEFLETQLPILKANLDAAEAALKGYQVRTGTLDLSREAQAMLQRSVDIEKALSEAELQRSDLAQKFTPNHPALLSLTDKIEKLRGERNNINGKMRELPGTELDSARLTRDVRVSSELYNLLLNKAQSLRVVKSGTIGNVRILDKASVPDKPVSPMATLVLALSLLLGLTAGVAAAFTRKSLYAGLDDPEMVEQVTGVTVYATVPRSTKQGSVARTLDRRLSDPLLAAVDPGDPAVEAMRSLRTGLQFALLEAKNNIIMVTGPTAEVGKSFVSANLAYVMAAAGKRILLVDGDLRRGRIHKFFGASRAPGLSDVLTGTALMADATRKSQIDNLQWLPTGRIPPNPAELLESDRFGRVLADIAARYDLVIIDTAPILPVTDAALIGRYAGTSLFVLRAGAHPVREVLSAVKRLAQNGVRVQGAVFNDVSGAGARYSKYGYQYRYDSRA